MRINIKLFLITTLVTCVAGYSADFDDSIELVEEYNLYDLAKAYAEAELLKIPEFFEIHAKIKEVVKPRRKCSIVAKYKEQAFEQKIVLFEEYDYQTIYPPQSVPIQALEEAKFGIQNKLITATLYNLKENRPTLLLEAFRYLKQRTPRLGKNNYDVEFSLGDNDALQISLIKRESGYINTKKFIQSFFPESITFIAEQPSGKILMQTSIKRKGSQLYASKPRCLAERHQFENFNNEFVRPLFISAMKDYFGATIKLKNGINF